MASINVWNHGTSAQRRPVQFTVPLSLGWGNLLEVGGERLIAEKQYDDGQDAVYVCPAPTAGWAVGRVNHPVAAYSGPDPQYLFKFAEPFAGEFQCGTPQTFNDRFLPKLKVYGTGSPSPIEVPLGPLLPFSEGTNPFSMDWIPNGGNRRKMFATDGHVRGWHFYFWIVFDAELAVAEFGTIILPSDETAAESISRTLSAEEWRVRCSHIDLEWDRRTSVKPKFSTEGITIAGPGNNIARMSTTFTGSTSPSTYNYATWSGYWISQLSWSCRGFILGRQEDGSSTTFSDDEFAAAAPLYGVLDAETLDGHYLAGLPSGHGVTITRNVAQTSPDWADETKHFWSWNRGAGGSDSTGNHGVVMNAQPKDQGTQGNQGLIHGHSVMLGYNSPRDFEAGAIDIFKRPLWVWRDGLFGGRHDTNREAGVYHRIGGAAEIPDVIMRRGIPDFCTHNQIIKRAEVGTNGYTWGRNLNSFGNIALAVPVSSGSGSISAIGIDNQHPDHTVIPATKFIVRDPQSHLNCLAFLQRLEIEARRPNIGGSSMSGDREIGRKLNAVANLWRSSPGLRARLMALMFGSSSSTGPEYSYYHQLKNLGGIWFLSKPRDPNTPEELNDDPLTIPNWVKAPQRVGRDGLVRNSFTPSQFRFGPDPGQATNAFGYVSPLWEMVGAAGFLSLYQAIIDTNGGGYIDIATDTRLADLRTWGMTIVENILQFGTRDEVSTGRRLILENMLVYISGHMLHSDGMTTYYPPTAGRHPFLTDTDPLHQYMATNGGPNLQSWSLGGLNWYRNNVTTGNFVVVAQRVWEDMLRWRNGNQDHNDRYYGWQQIHWTAISDLTTP